MTIYDVFRRMIEARPFQDFERQEALKLLDELERMNAFGTVARQAVEGHEHEWLPLNPGGRLGAGIKRCKICSLEERIFHE